MSKEIDQRVVEMRFDNREFEKNVSNSMSTLDKLKQKLNFNGATKGLENINEASKKVNMSGLGTAIETINNKFSALEVVGITALANITNSAINAGKRIFSALTIDPIKMGFDEYETQINAIQTILANTSHQGTTLGDVNAALDELNKYADMTIYNFTEMTKNIGTFTAAGLDLKTSTEAIKGIANLAAVSGSTSQQASNAMYQLSQALAAGTVSLQDWNSVVNAGMGGKVFQDALIRTAAAMQGVTEETFKAKNVTTSFRESINAQTGTGWLTADVLSQTLRQFTGDLTDAELAAMGFTEEQIKNIQQMATTANDAATKVKTVTQLWDTLKESVQSGWTQSWEIFIGDFGEAKELLTELSDLFGGMINKSAESRNALLYDALSSNWKKLTDEITDAGLSADDFSAKVEDIAKNKLGAAKFDEIVSDYGSLEKAFKNGALSSDFLNQALIKVTGTSKDVVKKFSEVTKGCKNQNEILNTLKKSGYELTDAQFEELNLNKAQIQAIKELSKQYGLANGSVKEFTDNISVSGGRELLIDALRVSIRNLVSVFGTVGKAWRDVFPPTTADQLYGITKSIQEFALALRPSEETLDKLYRTFKGLFSVLDIGKQALSAFLSPIVDFLSDGKAASFGDMLLTSAANLGDFLTELNNGIKSGKGFSVISDGITKALNGISNATGGLGGIFTTSWNTIKNVLGWMKDGIGDIFSWISENISAGDIFVGLAGGGLFVLLKKLSGFIDNVRDVFEGFFGGGDGESIKDQFSDILGSVHDSLNSFSEGIKVASLVGIAAAVMMLTSSLERISELEVTDVATSLVAIRLMIASLNSGFKSLSKILKDFNAKGTLKASVAMIAIAKAIDILANAMVKMSDLSWGEIAKGLVSTTAGIMALSTGIKIIGKGGVSLRTSVAILALAKACEMLSVSLKEFSKLSWDEIARGLVSMGGALAIFTASLSVISKAGGFGALLGGTAILIAVQSLDEISENLKRLGNLAWDEIGRGLSAMGGALLEFTVVLSVLGKIGGFGSVLGATAILIAVQSLDEISENLKRLGNLAWDEIGRGLSAMGGAMLEVATISGILGKLSGFSGILGATTLVIAVQSLEPLANSLQKFADMSWDEIGRGLVAMGGAMLEVAVISGALGYLTNIAGLVGAGTLTLAISGLNDLADAFKKFGSMSWDEIGRGLSAMGLAMGETAIGGLLNTFSGFGASAISTIAEPLGVLADSIKKWENVEVPEGLGGKLSSLSGGIFSFTFGGNGADAISTVAEPLGVLAGSVNKWVGITVPENLGSLLSSLAVGVKSFTFSGFGADSISTVAEPLGVLAGSVSKWTNVTVPTTMEEDLTGLANGVKAFSFAFLGGWSIDGLVEPLSSLADTVKKWNGVRVSTDIQSILEGLAEGVGAFNFSWLGGWSIDGIVEPLADLADSVKKWNGVSLSGVSYTLKSFAEGLKALGDVGVKSIVSEFQNGSDDLVSAVSSMINSMNSTITNAKPNVTKIFSSVIDDALTSIKKKENDFTKIGENLMKNLSKGLSSKKTNIGKEFTAIITSSIKSIKSEYTNFFDVGKYLVEGFAKGISANSYKAEAQAKAMAKAATIAAEKELDINSPSVVFATIGKFVVDGFAKGIKDKLSLVKETSTNIGSTLTNTVKSYFKSKPISETISEDIESDSDNLREIGTKVVGDIAEGITEDMSAEEAAKQKAQNIVDAFQEELDKYDGASNTADLEYSLWEKLNGDSVTDSEKNTEKLNLLNKQYENQLKKVELAESEYRMMIDTFGDYSDEAKDSYDKLLQQKIDLADLSQEIIDLKGSQVDEELDILSRRENMIDLEQSLWEKQNENTATETEKALRNIYSLASKYQVQLSKIKIYQQEYSTYMAQFGSEATKTQDAYEELLNNQINLTEVYNELTEARMSMLEEDSVALKKFNSYLKANSAKLEKEGYSDNDIQEMAMKAAGYDVDSLLAKMKEDIKTSVVSSMETVTSVYRETASATLGTLAADFSDQGKSYATSIGTGMTDQTDQVMNSAITMLKECTNAMRDQQGNWYNVGTYLVSGFIVGIRDNVERAAREAARMAIEAYNAAMGAIGAHSPARKFIEVGKYAVQGFAKGISDFSNLSSNASATMAGDTVTIVTDSISKIADAIENGLDTQPTIRPVLDLSNIESETSRLNTMFSRNQAISISSDMKRSNEPIIQNGNGKSNSPNQYNFVQNNYSPKSLSRVDLYRQTKNQFSAFERMVER